MLYLVCAPAAASLSFDSTLSIAGKAQAALLQQWLAFQKVYMFYAAANRRSLDSISPFIIRRRQAGEYSRVEIRFELCDRVMVPEQKPHALDVDYVRSMGMQPQNVLGVIAGPEATQADFERRVLDWFTNDCLEKYRDAPNPTAIVADSTVLNAIATFLTRRQKNLSIPLLNPGDVIEFKSDGLNLAFSQILHVGY